MEDNPDDEALTLRALKKNRILNEVLVARDGADALEVLFGANADLIRLVLLDLKLPKISGLDVLKRLRADERTRLPPVVILTTSNEDADIARCYEIGANSYVRKPVDFHEFVAAVGSLGMY